MALMIRARYTATLVACVWAGVVIELANGALWAGSVSSKFSKMLKKLREDRLTDKQTNQPTYRAGYRVA